MAGDVVRKLFCFPRQSKRADQWWLNMGMKLSGRLYTNTQICDRHFSKESFVPLCFPLCLKLYQQLHLLTARSQMHRAPNISMIQLVKALLFLMQYQQCQLLTAPRQVHRSLKMPMILIVNELLLLIKQFCLSPKMCSVVNLNALYPSSDNWAIRLFYIHRKNTSQDITERN